MRVWILCAALLIWAGRVFAADGGQAPDLSDAMKSAASGDQTPVEGSHSRHSDESHHDSGDSGDDGGDSFFGSIIGSIFCGFVELFHGAQYTDVEYGWQLPVDAEYVVPFNGDIQGMTRFSITPLSLEGEKAFFGFYFNGGLVNFKNNSLPEAATSGGSTIGMGAAFRYYFVPPEKAVNPYLTARIGWQQLSWTYRNPVVADDGGTISDDRLGGLDTYVGGGIAFHREEIFSLYGELGFGGTFLANTTTAGFHNNVFDNYGYFAVKLGLSLKF